MANVWVGRQCRQCGVIEGIPQAPAIDQQRSLWSGWRRRRRSRPILFDLRSSKGFTVFVVTVAIFTDLFLYASIVPVIPFSLEHRAGVPEQDVQYWVSILVAMYGVTLLAGSPPAGWLADWCSSRFWPFIGGLVALVAGSLMMCFGVNVGTIIFGRLLQGFAAAIVWVVGLAILVDAVGSQEIGKAMGYISLGWTLAFLFGPLLGGLVYSRVSYFPVFYMSFSCIFLDVVLRLMLIERRHAEEWRAEEARQREEQERAVVDEAAVKRYYADWRCSTPLTPGLSTMDSSLGLPLGNEGGHYLRSPEIGIPQPVVHPPGPNHHEDPRNSAINTASDAPRSTFSAAVEPRREASPSPSAGPARQFSAVALLRPYATLLSSPRFMVAIWGSFFQSTILGSFDGVLPLHVKAAFGWDSFGAGLIFLAIFIPGLTGPLLGVLIDRFGTRGMAVAGYLISCPLLVLLRLVDRNDGKGTINEVVLLCFLLAALGITINMSLMPMMAECTHVVGAKELKNPGIFGERGAYAQAYCLFNMAFAGGILLGPIWGGMVVDKAGWGTLYWSLGLIEGLNAIPTIIWTGGHILKRGRRGSESSVVSGDGSQA